MYTFAAIMFFVIGATVAGKGTQLTKQDDKEGHAIMGGFLLLVAGVFIGSAYFS